MEIVIQTFLIISFKGFRHQNRKKKLKNSLNSCNPKVLSRSVSRTGESIRTPYFWVSRNGAAPHFWVSRNGATPRIWVTKNGASLRFLVMRNEATRIFGLQLLREFQFFSLFLKLYIPFCSVNVLLKHVKTDFGDGIPLRISL